MKNEFKTKKPADTKQSKKKEKNLDRNKKTNRQTHKKESICLGEKVTCEQG